MKGLTPFLLIIELFIPMCDITYFWHELKSFTAIYNFGVLWYIMGVLSNIWHVCFKVLLCLFLFLFLFFEWNIMQKEPYPLKIKLSKINENKKTEIES